MSLTAFLILAMNGLTLAALLFIMASGLTLTFGVMRVINLAHGAFYMLGGYVGVAAYQATDSLALGLVAGGGSGVAAGLFVERILLRRVRIVEQP